MWKNGEIQDMWAMASQTHLTFNMVGGTGAGRWTAGCLVLAAWRWLPGLQQAHLLPGAGAAAAG